MNSTLSDSQKTEPKKSWKWWQNNAATTPTTAKSPDIMICSEEEELQDEDNHADNNKIDCSSSIAQSSLMVHHSIHSKESEDITSTTSIKSKPWVSKKLKQPTITSQEGHDDDHEEEDDQNTLGTTQSINKIEANSTNIKNSDKTTPSSSLMNAVPSITSSTVPVYNFNPEVQQQQQQPRRRKSAETALFSGIKAKFGKWVNRSDSNKD